MNDFDRETFLQKPLPSSPESERVILGAVLLDNDAILQCLEKNLAPEDFYSPLHRRVYKAMLALFERGERLDPILISEELKKDGSTDSIGGTATITNLTYGLPHFSEVYDYIKVVKEKAVARNLVTVCSATISEVLSEEVDVTESLDTAEQKIYMLRNPGERSGFTSSFKIVESAHDEIVKNSKTASNNALLGLSTGFKDVNEYTSGLQEADLIVIAGRPSIGKTAYCIDIMHGATKDDPNAVVAFFSLEMSKRQVGIRQLTQLAMIDSKRYRAHGLERLTTSEKERVAEAARSIQAKRMFVDDSPGLNALEIQAMARHLAVKEKRIDLIVVDQLSLMEHMGKAETRIELGNSAKVLKAVAKRLSVPVILLHQLSRGPESRNPPRPMMSDLYESGAIEAHADIIMLLYRSEYYKKTLKKGVEEGVAEVLIEKNRNGPTGTVKLQFTDYCSHFEDLAKNF